MSATAALREAADTVPIEHETSERVVRTIVFAVPPAALGVAGWLAWGGILQWQASSSSRSPTRSPDSASP